MSTQHTIVEAHPIAIRLRNVTKTFGRGESAVAALRGIDIDIPAGELTMLVGPSGCGKTTLISILAGLLARDGGELRVFGQDLATLKRDRLARWRRDNVGFIFQQFNLVPQLTVAENVSVPLVLQGESVASAVRRANELLETLGLEGRGKSAPLNLSGGQQQRVAIARALIHDPRLLVCDEPTSALDAELGRRVMELIRGRSTSPDRAVVVVTHDDRIFHLADSIAHLDDGRIDQLHRVPRDTPARAAH
ncbi:MAG: ABC transporter ATP-binding protein [Planctomycetota bacterium]|jgi:putative ABC transport system ATP-binding protein|nr:MAG: ABC transporter ATP-binding protein [Planctomycetota bacterium]RLS96451.1 MAG: ABC transporter ATP-binding protein [Planctomycetota bacterium]